MQTACSIAAYPMIQPRLLAANGEREPWDEPPPLLDDELVEATRLGDASAFEVLIERHNRFCFSKAYSILRNREDAEDEVQNAWAQAWTHLDSYEGHGAFCAWLCRIVSNQCLMRLRKVKLASLISVDEVIDSEGSFRLEAIDQKLIPEDAVGAGEVATVLKKEIGGVPRLLREVLVMHDQRHLAMRDIALLLGITVPAAKSRLMRARIELRNRLSKHEGQRGPATLMRKIRRGRAAYVRAS